MDDGTLGNNNRNLNGGSGDRLTAEFLPLIDTRLLSQSELRALSRSSSLFLSSSSSLAASTGVDDDLTPKIDRSVFNESAGSRKQTFLRLRLARHPPPPRPASPQRRRDDSSREEVASLLRSLFSVDSVQTKEEDEDEENEGQKLISFPIHSNGIVYQNPYFDSVQGISGNETRRRSGRPRKILNPSELGISMDSNPGKRKRGRPPKSRDGFKEESVNLENREGSVVDLTALSCIAEDPYGEELRRRTMGLVTMEDLLGFLEEMNGEWVNAGKEKKKKKVVKACDLGGYLPRGWKLMLCINNKGSNLWLDCHRYISPNGLAFATWKEVATYLQSLLEPRSKNQHNTLQSDNKTLEQLVMANKPLVDNSDSMDLHVLNPETSQILESKRTSSVVSDAANRADNADTTDPLKTSLVEKGDKAIPEVSFLNGDKKNGMNRRDYNMENVAPGSEGLIWREI